MVEELLEMKDQLGWRIVWVSPCCAEYVLYSVQTFGSQLDPGRG